jgi:hypothetical protein
MFPKWQGQVNTFGVILFFSGLAKVSKGYKEAHEKQTQYV